jgi:hypothetical protein
VRAEFLRLSHTDSGGEAGGASEIGGTEWEGHVLIDNQKCFELNRDRCKHAVIRATHLLDHGQYLLQSKEAELAILTEAGAYQEADNGSRKISARCAPSTLARRARLDGGRPLRLVQEGQAED